ncbi:MAG: hypothetical protein IJY93_02520 [Clostridia bacterium]|nr:hypothetical protein [Clostridia bacterium]
MVKAKFSTEMLKIIKSMVGRVFCSYERGNTVSNEAYGNLQINSDNFAIEILNEVKELPFYDSTEDISCFTCKKKALSEHFKPYCEEPSEKHLINEKILAVSIIEDSISINNGEYDVAFDMAIIVETNEHKYTFSRGWFFSETIDISVDKDFDNIYPISRVVEDWSDEGENKVSVIRTIEKL